MGVGYSIAKKNLWTGSHKHFGSKKILPTKKLNAKQKKKKKDLLKAVNFLS